MIMVVKERLPLHSSSPPPQDSTLQEYKSLLDDSVEKTHGLQAIIATLQEQVDGQVSSFMPCLLV